MPVLNRQLYISYTTLIDEAPFPVRYGYITWVTEEPDVARVSMPSPGDPIAGAIAMLGDVQVIRRAPNLSGGTKVSGTFATEVPGPPTPGIIEPSIVGDAEPAVVGTTFTAAEGGWVLATNSAGQELPIEEYRYEWRRDGVAIETETPFGPVYVAQAADAGTTITCAIRGVTFGQADSVSEVVTNGIAVTAGDELTDPIIMYDGAVGVLEAPGNPAENLDLVEIWEDQGLSTINAEQPSSLFAPTFTTLSSVDSYPVVVFNHGYEVRMSIAGFADPSTSWTLYVALYDAGPDYEYAGDSCLLDIETGPLRFMLQSVAEGANVSLFDGAWRTFGAQVVGSQVLTWVLDGATNLCRLFRGRTQVGTDQPYTPRDADGAAMLGAFTTALGGFMEAEVARIALYPVAHNATLRTQVWDNWATEFPTLL